MKRILVSVLLIFAMMAPNSISAAATSRFVIDQADDLTGYQIRMFYVVPADGTDRGLDTNGRIATWLDQASAYTKRKIGLTPAFDTYKNIYDIGFLKSKYSLAELASNPLEKLRSEVTTSQLGALKVAGFIIDGDISPGLCGLAQRPSDVFFVTLAPGCWKDTPYYNEEIPETFIARVIVHEWFHTLGVKHICQENELMWATDNGCTVSEPTIEEIDEQRKYYIRADLAGVDISILPVWLETNRLQKIFVQPLKTYFPSSINRSDAINYWATFDPISSLATAKCITLINGIEVATTTKVLDDGWKIDCYSSISPTSRLTSKITMKVVWEDLWNYSEVSKQSYLSAETSNSKVCTGPTCVVGDIFESKPEFCWKSAFFSSLQVQIAGAWVDFKKQQLSTKDALSNGCSTAYPFSAMTRIKLLNAGTFRYRWIVYQDSLRSVALSTGTGVPFQVEVKGP